LAKLKTEPATQLERIAAVHEKYAAVLTKHAELTARFDAIIGEANGPRGRVDGVVDGKTGSVSYHAVPLAEQARRSQVSWVSQAPKPVAKPVVRHSGAVALVGDLLSPQPVEEISPPPPPPSWSGAPRLAELSAEAEAIQEALKLLAPELARGRKEYSKLVAAQRGGEFSEIVERVVDAARALCTTLLEHHRFIDALRQDGVAYQQLRPLNLERFGNLDEPFSPLMQLILDAVEKKLVSADKIPDLRMPAPIQYFSGGN
jgi:hypothetical protein